MIDLKLGELLEIHEAEQAAQPIVAEDIAPIKRPDQTDAGQPKTDGEETKPA